MAYCVLSDVVGVNPKRTYDATSTPTSAQVGEYIDRIAAEINVILQGRGVTTPASSPEALVTFLKQLNAFGAASMAEQAMFPESKGLMTTPSAQVLWKRYRDGLEFLQKGELPLETDGSPLAFSFFERNIGREDEPEADPSWSRPKFGKNKEF